MDYELIKLQVMDFVAQHNDGCTPFIDLVMEFCFRNSLPEELVGDAISESEDLVNLIKWNSDSQHSLLEDF